MTKRVLLDEGVPRHLAAPLEAAGFSCTPYPRSWKQMKNGELLRLAERQQFDILISSDKNIYAQQNLRGRILSIHCAAHKPMPPGYGTRCRYYRYDQPDQTATMRR
jgi:hypothetical protein